MMNRVSRKYSCILLVFITILLFINQIYLSYGNTGILKKIDSSKSVQTNNDFLKHNKSDNSISKKTIVIDPGHGGVDTGTSKDGLVEKDINLSIAKKLQTYFIQLGYNVFMTRYSDVPSYKPTNIFGSEIDKDLNGRINFAKEKNANLFVSIHVNSLPEDPGINGSIVYYYPKIDQSKKYAISVQNELNNIISNNMSRSKNDIRTEDFYVIKNSIMPSILIETGFITNNMDYRLLSMDSFQDKLAKAISIGIDKLKQEK